MTEPTNPTTTRLREIIRERAEQVAECKSSNDLCFGCKREAKKSCEVDIPFLLSLISTQEGKIESERDQKNDALSQLASVTDLLNIWAREAGVAEAYNESEVKQVVGRLWTDAARLRGLLTIAEGKKIAAARAAIEAAPHYCTPSDDWRCSKYNGHPVCNCWKAEALADLGGTEK